jgi:hypothetical protein
MRTIKVYKYEVKFRFGYKLRLCTDILYLRAMDHQYYVSIGFKRLDEQTYTQKIKEYL